MAIASRVGVPVSGTQQPRRAYWQGLVEAQQRSGLSVAAFCRRRGLRKGTLSLWKWKLAREAEATPGGGAKAGRPTRPAPFVPVQIAASPRPRGVADEFVPASELEIALAGGRLVRVRGLVDPSRLTAILRGVEALGC